MGAWADLQHALSPAKGSGHEQLRDYIATVQPQTNAYAELMPSPGDAGFWRILDQVVDRYGPLNALQLCTMSHEPGGPWDKARKLKQATIPDDTIRSCFREMLK
ncbi:hypothetical protein [Mitsuaria sp. 7]|uniref:hypothetical protein n=1 Tax=Mitsuaria sp. 7 TaxID=1658665 RepID=UPI0007DE0637|nr:hypothetical protein [Mitsuaria sp. 7]ANH66472.1 hypothetical protein ABE85_00880 [Mitsuaria sp. 7]